jgi:hypothetical protein
MLRKKERRKGLDMWVCYVRGEVLGRSEEKVIRVLKKKGKLFLLVLERHPNTCRICVF